MPTRPPHRCQLNLPIFEEEKTVTGEGVIKDLVEAHAWWNVAGAAGHEGARKNIVIAEPQMTREQIAEATKLARERFEKFGKKAQ